MLAPGEGLELQNEGPRYLSLSHIAPVAIDAAGGSDAALTIFAVPTGQELRIQPDTPGHARIYRGVLDALSGSPKTEAEVAESLGIVDKDDRDFMQAVFTALEGVSAITAEDNLTGALAPTWDNPKSYSAQGDKALQRPETKQSYVVEPGDEVFPLSVDSSFELDDSGEFDSRQPLQYQSLQRILVNSYRAASGNKRPTQSPGGIHPVTVHAIIPDSRVVDEDGNAAIPNGVYQYNPRDVSLTLRTRHDSDQGVRLVEHLTDDLNAREPAVWIVLGVDVGAFRQKYGNASLILTGMAVGSVQQRILEEAEREGYGAVSHYNIRHVYGDLALQNPGNIKTALAIGIGVKGEGGASERQATYMAQQLARVRVGTEGLITDVEPLAADYNCGNGIRDELVRNNFVSTCARYPQATTDGGVVDGWSYGTATTTVESELKARAEALERIASGNMRIDAVSAADELDAPWLDPRALLTLDEDQRNYLGIEEFTHDMVIDWTAGTRMSDGAKVYAPTSSVYYPYSGTNPNVGDATSNGVAAHFDKDEAIRRGMLELIERDAIMRTWILRQEPQRIPHNELPSTIASRVQEVAATGRQVDILDITQDNGVPVYMVAVRGETFPYFYSGAAASFNPEQALHKALDEAIGGVSARLVNEEYLRGEEAKKRAQGIFDLESHGMLYSEDTEAAASLDWMFKGKFGKLPKPADIPRLEDLWRRYQPVVFDLDNPAPGNELHVVRVSAEDLIPIVFGEAGVPYTHRTLPSGTPAPTQHHFFD